MFVKRILLDVLAVLTVLSASCAPVRNPQPLIWNVGTLPELQAAMTYARPGAEIIVRAGTYNGGPLIISASGTAAQPITLRCETPLACTINSGSARSLITSGNRGWWVVEGFRFISTMAVGGGVPEQSTVNFGYDFWGEGDTAERGNDGFVLRDCYVEGTVYIYGSDSLVENCELNGKLLSNNGLSERGKPSERNVFRNNIIHDYTQRGGWSVRGTSDTLWEGNTIYNIAPGSRGNGIDCDGASIPTTNCRVRNNLIYDIGGDPGVLLENAFGSIVEGNIIHHAGVGVGLINYGVESDHTTEGGIEYRDDAANIIIRNNIIYSTSDGILCKGVRGGEISNNTIHGTTQTPGYWAAIALAQYKGWYCPQWIITGNIISQPARTAIWLEGDSGSGTAINGNFYSGTFSADVAGSHMNYSQWQTLGWDGESKTGDPMFVNPSAGDFHLQANSPACGMGALPCGGGP
jgi:parallel beta-helix repeat protein